MKARAKAEVFMDCVEIILYEEYEGKRFLASPPEMVEVKQKGLRTTATFTMDYPDAKVLMDNLWEAGIRPSQNKADQPSLKATQDHLSDMRKIAFDRLKININ